MTIERCACEEAEYYRRMLINTAILLDALMKNAGSGPAQEFLRGMAEGVRENLTTAVAPLVEPDANANAAEATAEAMVDREAL